MEATGKITMITEIQSGLSKTGKEWQKLNFVIDTGAEFNPEICFSVFGGQRCGEFLVNHKVGDEVKVQFNLSSREHDGRYYHNVDARKVEGFSK